MIFLHELMDKFIQHECFIGYLYIFLLLCKATVHERAIDQTHNVEEKFLFSFICQPNWIGQAVQLIKSGLFFLESIHKKDTQKGHTHDEIRIKKWRHT